MEGEVTRALDAKLGAGTVKAIPEVSGVGAKAGKQLQVDGVRALLGAILLIVIYVAFRFDFRYGPGTIVALLHDAVITGGRLRRDLQGVLAHHPVRGAHHHRLFD